jgi:hypothetical protein
MEDLTIREVINMVNKWAVENDPHNYWHGSRMSYFRSALNKNIISLEQYNAVQKHYANLWTYVAD